MKPRAVGDLHSSVALFLLLKPRAIIQRAAPLAFWSNLNELSSQQQI
jgi:hypothetical protein